jgi:rod shape-determining protein MreC
VGSLIVGAFHLSFLAPYAEQAHLKIEEAKVAALQTYQIQVVERFWTYLGIEDLLQKTTYLEDQLIAARLEAQRARFFSQENEELRRLLALPIPEKFTVLGAHILDAPEGQKLLLDVGSTQGVRQDAAVVGPEGLLGRVTQVEPNWSQVLRITDGASRIPVSFYPSGAHAVLVGDFSQTLRVELLREHLSEDNQTAVTSEIPGVFPGGIPVGTLAESATRVIPAASGSFPTHVCVLIPMTTQEKQTSHVSH